ncbi:hypothetical protein PG993_008356 [Apiospora rasikravindrae]|uniref:Uncharacterized protein n=1 Tax=Apiospora rasikravindrae TaxID=990691 RepID=A0ABR1T044_9PEZI
MAEKAQQVNHSIENIRRDLELLRNVGALRPEQYASITAQLPAPGGYPSNYVDARYGGGGGYAPPPNVSPDFPQAIAQQAQDPNHPANPKHSKHSEWAKSLAEKFGNAMVLGGGATLGSDVVNSAFNALKH